MVIIMSTVNKVWEEATVRGIQRGLSEIRKTCPETDYDTVTLLDTIENKFKASKNSHDVSGLLTANLHTSLLQSYVFDYNIDSLKELKERIASET